MIKEIMRSQFGDYVHCIIEPCAASGGKGHSVRMAGAQEYLSFHETFEDAVAAIKRYQSGDRRRRK